MAVPKRRVSKQRRNTRKSANWKLAMPGIAECPQCKEPVLSHRACKNCGYYKGSKVIPDKVKKAAE